MLSTGRFCTCYALPGISIRQAEQLLQAGPINWSIPGVITCLAKAGARETATDPAPLSMLETVIS